MCYNRKMGTIRINHINLLKCINIYVDTIIQLYIFKSISIKKFPSMKCRKKDSHPLIYIAHVENLK